MVYTSKRKLKNVINFVFIYSGFAYMIFLLSRFRTQAKILAYHRVNNYPLVKSSISDRLTVSFSNLQKQMNYLIKHFNVI